MSQQASDPRCDVVILGSGIGSTILGAILARHGHQITIIEKGMHPRFAIGESTIPQTSAMMALLAERYDVPELFHLSSFRRLQRVSGTCGIKNNFGFLYGRRGQPADFRELNQTSATFGDDAEMHLYRQDVDAYYLQVALHYGCRVLHGTQVDSVDLADDEVVVRGPAPSGPRASSAAALEVRARYLVDGGGFGALLPKQLGLREQPCSMKTHSRSLFTHMIDVRPFESCVSLPRTEKLSPFHQGTLHHVFDGGWMWIIPFDNHEGATNGVVSVGLLLDPRRHPKTEGPPEQELAAFLSDMAVPARQLEHAKPIRPWISTGRIQYNSTQTVGPRWALLSHSAGFVDPLFSRGLCNTAETTYLLAARLLGALEADDFSMERFQGLEALQQGLLSWNDRLVACAYISFRDYGLWNAWWRVWTLASLYGTLRAFHARLKYLASDDPSFLRSLEDDPMPGAIAAGDPDVMAVFDACANLVEGVEGGTVTVEAAVLGIYERLRKDPCVAPLFPFTDPEKRASERGLKARLKLIHWTVRHAPPALKSKYFYAISRRARSRLAAV